MESWRQELYNTLSHSVEGSTWKDHKYVAIVNGKYIYPEDLKKEKGIYATTGTINGASKTSKASSGSSSSGSSTATSENQTTAVNPDSISYTDKGKVKSYRYLPKDPAIGDVYYLEDTKQKVYWNGEIWTPYVEKKTAVTNGKTSSYGADEREGEYSISPNTIKVIRTLIESKGSQSKPKAYGNGGR